MLIRTDACLICESADLKVSPAVVSGFLLERVWNNSIDRETCICHCQKCGFAFYAIRLDDDEMGRLYENYRDDFYQKQRQKHDSWYTKEINELLNCEPAVIKRRRESMNMFLSRHIDVVKIRSVLDYGGNTGAHIPDCLSNAKKYVYDISGVETVDGVLGFKNFDDAKKQRYDLVMSNNLHEHVSDPLLITKQMKELVAEDGYMYIEVPFDSPFYKHKTGKSQYLFNKYFSLKVIIDRFLLNLKHPFVMPEHINYFTERSCKEMITYGGGGGDVLVCETYAMDSGLGKTECIRMLVK